jgi:S-DNA-T family DNA segregation ATPase FtsK/SpoIIIE
MKIKLTVARSGSAPTADVIVTTDAAATVGDLAAALRDRDPIAGPQERAGALTLRVWTVNGTGDVLGGSLELGEAPLASGTVVSIVSEAEVPSSGTGTTGRTQVRVRVVRGPDVGAVAELGPGSYFIGRDTASDIRLNDPLASKNHARVDVLPGVVRIVDLNSANGVLIDDEPLPRADLVRGQEVVIGDSTLSFEMVEIAAQSGSLTRQIAHLRSPRVEPRYPGTEFDGPSLPTELENRPFPWIAMVAPVILGGVMFAFTQSPVSLVFVALSPVLLLGNYLSNRLNQRRKQRLDIEKFEEQLRLLEQELAEALTAEQYARLAESPSTVEVVEAARLTGPLLWTRRPEHWSFLTVRLGCATQPSRNSVTLKDPETALPDYLGRAKSAIARYTHVGGVPVTENLFASGALGIAGTGQHARDVTRAILAQIAGLHSPSELVVAAIVGGGTVADFDWLTWLPHTSSAHSPLVVPHLANSSASAGALLADLEGIVASRSKSALSQRGAVAVESSALGAGARVAREPESVVWPDAPTPAILLLVADDAPIDVARIVQLAERGAGAGIYPIWLASSESRLPAVARTFVQATGTASSVGFVRSGVTLSPVELETLGAAEALAFARGLAGVTDAGALIADESDLPRTVNLLSLVGSDLAVSTAPVLERWRLNESVLDRTPSATPKRRKASRLRAIVGHAGLDSMHLDLRAHGPHALVGGTTGSGKSEFLQAWVLGMAIEYSPDRLTFLFVDYKGGSAFADCARLPHKVGMVTDLSPHLVRRALTSLRAEIHHRERLLARKKVKDLLDLERTGDPECPPALVIVIDEFAALVSDVPEFVDGVVDIAQRGRSLGIHVIMATQRPAGVIKDNLRANTNLRIALRMADESDSSDVVGAPIAAGFDPTIPGRAIAKTGPGRLTGFQSAYAGGWTSDTPPRPSIEIAELRFGSEVSWEEPPELAETADEEGPTDQSRIVDQLIQAAREADIPQPRQPWLDLLPRLFDLTKLRQRTDTELLLGVRDVPERQAQEEVYFHPDVDGNLAVYGTGGSGKSVTLRTLAVAAGITPRGGPVDVYGIDYANGGLGLLDVLPHVGSIIGGDEPDRVIRLLRTLKGELDARAAKYAEVRAGSIVDYRKQAAQPDERRVLLLIDGFPAFRQDFEGVGNRAAWYSVAQQLVVEGRQFGIHVAISADRPGSVPSSISSNIQRRVVLRLADDTGYTLLDVPNDILNPSSPPGRAIVDGFETQIALVGASPTLADQARVMADIAAAAIRAGLSQAAAIGALPREFPIDGLPERVGDFPAIGLGDENLQPVAFDPTGVALLAGPPGSGRTSSLRALIRAHRRAFDDLRSYYLGNPRSPLSTDPGWTKSATTIEDVAALAKEIAGLFAAKKGGRILVVVEGISEFLGSPADAAILELARSVKRSEHGLIAESETSTWSSTQPLLAEIKSGRRGFVLQPENLDGETLLKTPLPRGTRAEFPPGRAYFVERGRVTKLQFPILAPESHG